MSEFQEIYREREDIEQDKFDLKLGHYTVSAGQIEIIGFKVSADEVEVQDNQDRTFEIQLRRFIDE
jgi:hypothetical protein